LIQAIEGADADTNFQARIKRQEPPVCDVPGTSHGERKIVLSANLPAAKAFPLILVLAITGPAATRKTTAFDEKYSKHHYDLMSIYLTGTPNMTAPVVVVLHGDAPFVNPGHQYTFASNLADAVPGTRVVTVFEPSAADRYEAKLGVERAIAFGEKYTLKVVNDVAEAIESFKSQWNAPAVILVGDDGGAAVAAYVAALHPGLVQRAVLIRCPCDAPALTLDRTRFRRSPISLLALQSLSPLQALDQISKGTKVTVIAGRNDSITSTEIAHSYVARATALGISAAMILIPTRKHEMLNEPVVIEEIAKAIRDN
jgi:predicted esterase